MTLSYPTGALEVGRRSSQLLEWFACDGIRDGLLVARTNQVATLDGSSAGTIADAAGNAATAIVKMPRLVTTPRGIALALSHTLGETCSFAFLARPQALSLYQALVFTGDLTTAPTCARIGTDASGAGSNALLTSLSTTGEAKANFKVGGTSHVATSAATGVVTNDLLELLTQVSVTAGAVTLTQLACRNRGSVITSASVSGGSLFSAWSDATLRLILAATPIDSAYVSIRVAPGVRDFTFFRGL